MLLNVQVLRQLYYFKFIVQINTRKTIIKWVLLGAFGAMIKEFIIKNFVLEI